MRPALKLATTLAPRIRYQLGVTRKVGRIVPKRVSLVTTKMPASAAKMPAMLPMPSSWR